MQVRLGTDPYYISSHSGRKRGFLERFRGELVQCQEDYLRRDAFRLDSADITFDGERLGINMVIPLEHVTEIVDDVRLGLARCRICGDIADAGTGIRCCGMIMEQLVPGSVKIKGLKEDVKKSLSKLFYGKPILKKKRRTLQDLRDAQFTIN
jgi:hypothetical protein